MSGDIWDEPFVYALPTLGEVETEPLTLSHDEQRAVNKALDDIAECRAAAAVSAQNYMVWR